MSSLPLAAKSLVYGYRGRGINQPCDFVLETGGLCAMLGGNGVGKSTLLRTILGLLPPVQGQVWHGSVSLQAMTEVDRSRLLSYVPQAQAFGFGFDCLDVVLMASNARRGPLSRPQPQDLSDARDCLAQVGAEDLARQPFDELSGGQRQLVLIARALHQQARFLLLDEPCSHLDFGNQHRVLGLLRDLADQGHGILMTTHDPNHAEQVADSVLMLKPDGSVTLGPVGQQLTVEQLSGLYGPDAASSLTKSRWRISPAV